MNYALTVEFEELSLIRMSSHRWPESGWATLAEGEGAYVSLQRGNHRVHAHGTPIYIMVTAAHTRTLVMAQKASDALSSRPTWRYMARKPAQDVIEQGEAGSTTQAKLDYAGRFFEGFFRRRSSSKIGKRVPSKTDDLDGTATVHYVEQGQFDLDLMISEIDAEIDRASVRCLRATTQTASLTIEAVSDRSASLRLSFRDFATDCKPRSV